MAKRPRDGALSREKIIQVATELFAQRGYQGAGVDELAARSGIAKTAIYYHFGSKEGLLAVVLERAATVWIDGIQEAARQAGDPLERLDRGLAGMRAVLEDKPWIFKLLQILALEVADQKPEIRATLKAIIHRARAALVEGISDALGVAPPRVEMIASIILAVLDGLALGRQLDPDEVPLEDAFADLRLLTIFLVASRFNPDIIESLLGALPVGGALPRSEGGSR